MNYRLRRRPLCALLVSACLAVASGLVQAERVDTRILIDISGSMKRTDPDNLRAAALRLVTGLLPADSLAGIWTFGRYVNMEVAHGVVTDTWRERAERGAARIHSRGMFTNIEDAIRRATRGWQGAATDTRRNLILLTDGMVDVSKEAGANETSRARILQSLLPQLQARDINVMAVALSEEADHELLRTLAQSTAGWYELAADAAQLHRAFLHVFEKTTDTDAVPLEDNRFQVDASIKELTLLVFRSAQASPALLHAPDGGEYSASAPPPGASWRADQGYDLITIDTPQSGEWRVDAQLDPDNRVLVVTDLSLETGVFPNHRLPGDGLELEAWLSEAGERIERTDFLELVRVFAEHRRPGGEVDTYRLTSTAGHGFAAATGSLREEGEHAIVISASSDTFARERQMRFNVALPVRIDLGEAAQDYPLSVAARPEFIGAEDMQVRASVRGPGGVASVVELVSAAGDTWQGAIGPLPAGEHRLNLQVSGTSPTGQPVAFDLPALPITPPALPAEPPAPSPAPEPPSAEPAFDGFAYAWQIGAANALALVIAGGLWWWRRRRNDDADLTLAELES